VAGELIFSWVFLEESVMCEGVSGGGEMFELRWKCTEGCGGDW